MLHAHPGNTQEDAAKMILEAAAESRPLQLALQSNRFKPYINCFEFVPNLFPVDFHVDSVAPVCGEASIGGLFSHLVR